MKLALFLLTLSLSTLAAPLKIKDYDWMMTDIQSRGLNKETLYKRMDRKFINLDSSICSNRALMWANDFKRFYSIDTGKIFVFYTQKKFESSLSTTWWYHVAPVVNEGSRVWVVDAGFPGFINGPLVIEDWLKKFTNFSNCKEINARETELVEYVYGSSLFPKFTSYGAHNCYYKIVPHTFWTPAQVAENLLGKRKDGSPVRVERDEIDPRELFQACAEATTNKLEYALGTNRKECKEYAGVTDFLDEFLNIFEY
jgi:hypothetical protein